METTCVKRNGSSTEIERTVGVKCDRQIRGTAEQTSHSQRHTAC